MKLSLNWLKDYVPLKISADELVTRLTMAGMEIEHVERLKDDVVLDIEITPNRPDCLSLLGLAREVAAVTDQRVNVPKIKTIKAPSRKCDVSIEDKAACSRYIGAVIEGVSIKHSEAQTGKRLEAVGSRPINNVVDVTNFLLMELGQPMHAFDYDKLEGGKIIVRRAKATETITTLDGEERKLDPSVLVIADAAKPLAIAGIKGGQLAEVTWETKNILLESAYFDPVLVRRTSRKLKLSTDSSYRFERGVDYAMVQAAAHRAMELILQTAGGKVTAYRDVQASEKSASPRKVTVSLSGVEHRLGCSVGSDRFRSLLKTLGCGVTQIKKDSFAVMVPTFRSDLRCEVDFDEEIARLTGYDQIPSTLPSVPLTNIPSDPAALCKSKIRSLCLAQGLDEIVTFSTMPEEFLSKTGITSSDLLTITNPLSQEQKIMRPSSVPSFLQVVQANFNNGRKHLRLFEIGKIYGQKKEQGVLSVLLTGAADADWRQPAKPYDFYDLKGVLETIFDNQEINHAQWSTGAQAAFLDSSRHAAIGVDGTSIGFAGRIADNILRAWDIKTKDVWFAEINLDWLCQRKQARKYFRTPSEFPAIVRDASLAVKDSVTLKQILDDISRHKIEILKVTELKDEYRGEGIQAGHRALTLSFTYQAKNKTLTDEEVDKVHSLVVESLINRLGVIQR